MGKGDFGGGGAEVGELAPNMSEAAAVAQAELGGDGVVNSVAVGVYGALVSDGVGDAMDEKFEVFRKTARLGAPGFCGEVLVDGGDEIRGERDGGVIL